VVIVSGQDLRMSTELNNITSGSVHESLTPSQKRSICSALIEDKVTHRFHYELKMDENSYRDSFQEAVGTIMNSDSPSEAYVSLVEPRIPFIKQIELLGIGLNPAIYYTVLPTHQNPYGVYLNVIGSNEELLQRWGTYQDTIQSLPKNLRPATPFEGINAAFNSILTRKFVSLPGGRYKMPGVCTGGNAKNKVLCLEQFLGKPRISHIRLSKNDFLVGMLTAYQ